MNDAICGPVLTDWANNIAGRTLTALKILHIGVRFLA
jgi:hypothetical protein